VLSGYLVVIRVCIQADGDASVGVEDDANTTGNADDDEFEKLKAQVKAFEADVDEDAEKLKKVQEQQQSQFATNKSATGGYVVLFSIL
jgi:predicted  nucleic acid-binding Zn-ribbon protein